MGDRAGTVAQARSVEQPPKTENAPDSTNQSSEERSTTTFFRWSGIVLVASFIIANPVARQLLCHTDVLGVPAHGWQMMSGFGDAVCDLRFRYKTPEDPILRHHEMFRTTHPPRQKRVQRKNVKDITRNICQKLPHGSEVFADVRCGLKGQWQQVSNKDVDACSLIDKAFDAPLGGRAKTHLVCTFLNSNIRRTSWIGFVCGFLSSAFFLGIIVSFAPRQHVHRIPFSSLVLGLTSTQVGSTRGLGLARIATASIFWARYGEECLPFQFAGVFNDRNISDPWGALMGVGLLASTAAMFVGYKSQISSAATATMAGVLLYWYGHSQGHESFIHHHCVFLALLPLLLAFTPCGNSFSVDRMMRRQSGDSQTDRGPLWGIYLFKLHLSVVYLFSAYDKMTPAWYDGHRLEQMTMYLFTGPYFPTLPGMDIDGGRELVHTLACLFGILTIAAELAIGIGIWFRATQTAVLAFGVLLHASMYVFCPVSTFSVSAYTAYLAILDHHIVDLFVGTPPPPPQAADPDAHAQTAPDSLRSRGKTPQASQAPPPLFSSSTVLTALIVAVLAVLAVPHHREALIQALAPEQPTAPTLALESHQQPPGSLLQPEAAATAALHLRSDVAMSGRFEANFQGRDRTGQSLDVSTPDQVRGLIRVRGFNKATHTAAKGSPMQTRDGKILVGSDTGALFCFEMDRANVSLNMLWSSGTWPSANGIHGTPCIIDDVAYVGAYDGALYAFDISTGRLLWKTQIGGYIGSSPLCVAAMNVVAVTVETDIPSGIISVLNATDGSRVWEDRNTVKGHPHSSVGLDEATGTLVFGANDRHLYAYNLNTGQLLWKHNAGGQIKGPVAVFEGRAYFGSWASKGCAVNLSSGQSEWCIDMHDKVMAGASVDARTKTVFFGGHSFWVVAVDAGSGDIKWSFATQGVVLGGMTVTKDKLVFGSNDGHLYALELATGALAWKYIEGRTGQVSSVPLVTDDGLIFFATRSYQDPDKEGSNHCNGRCVNAGSFHVLKGQ